MFVLKLRSLTSEVILFLFVVFQYNYPSLAQFKFFVFYSHQTSLFNCPLEVMFYIKNPGGFNSVMFTLLGSAE